MKKSFWILFFLVYSTAAFAQEEARSLLTALYKKHKQVQRYQADLRIEADIPMLKIPPADARLEFTQPDQLKFDSKSLAVLPKQGFSDFNAIISDTADITALMSGEEMVDGRSCKLVTILPGPSMSDLILAKLWIDADKKLVLRSQLSYRSTGTVDISYSYGKQAIYGLPDKLQFSMDVRNMKIPKAMTADMHVQRNKEESSKASERPAIIVLLFSNYRVNY
jgi:hypothetical protein